MGTTAMIRLDPRCPLFAYPSAVSALRFSFPDVAPAKSNSMWYDPSLGEVGVLMTKISHGRI